jgi:hypothetical protein
MTSSRKERSSDDNIALQMHASRQCSGCGRIAIDGVDFEFRLTGTPMAEGEFTLLSG